MGSIDRRPFTLPHKYLCGAGPVNCSDRVLRALSLQGLIPMDPEAFKMIDEIREMLKLVFFTKNKLTLVQQTSGTGGLETVIANVLQSGQKIMVAIAGVWGERIAQIADNYDLEVIRLSKPANTIYEHAYLEEQLKKHKPNLLFVTHGETSTGVLQPLEGLADICHKYDCLLAVDAIITLGSDPLYVDKWKIDITVGASQKAIGAPPGFSLLTFSPRAEKIVMERKLPLPFYFDIKGLAYYWNCFENNRGFYYTFSTNMMAALREALAEKLEEGIEVIWKRHKDIATNAWKNMEALGLKNFVPNPEHRLHSVNSYFLPEGIKWLELLKYLNEKYSIDVGFGIGPTMNICIRLGFIALNANRNVLEFVTESMKEGIQYCKDNPTDAPGTIPDVMFKK